MTLTHFRHTAGQEKALTVRDGLRAARPVVVHALCRLPL